MSILIAQKWPLAERPKGACPLTAEGAGEDRFADRIRLGPEDDPDAVRAPAELGQLEEDVARRLAHSGCAGEASGARGPRDLHLVREAFVRADDKRARQRLEHAPRADDVLDVSPLGGLPVALLVREDCVLDDAERRAARSIREHDAA